MSNIQNIPLKIGKQYTIYSFDTASRIPRKREITFVGNIREYKVHEGRKRASIGRFISRTANQPLALIINYTRDLIVEGWEHPEIYQEFRDRVVLNASFEQVYNLYINNLNPNYNGEKSLYCFKKYKEQEPTQAFPINEVPKMSRKQFLRVLENVEATPSEQGDAMVLSLPKDFKLKED